MFGSTAIVRGTVKNFKGHLIEAFQQGDDLEGLGQIMRHIPGTENGVCKSLCMNWIDHHANDKKGAFTDVARSMGSGHRRGGGNYAGVIMALDQVDYANAVLSTTSPGEYYRAKDKFTDEFLLKCGIRRQMKISNPALNLSPPGVKKPRPSKSLFQRLGFNTGRSNRALNASYARNMAQSIVGVHSVHYWSYKIISIHGSAGSHAIAAFVGADAMFFDPNYGIFYFEKASDFQNWFGAPGGFFWETGYIKHLCDDYVIKSYAPEI